MPVSAASSSDASTNSESETDTQGERLSNDELQALRDRDPRAVRRHVYSNRDFIRSVLQRYTESDEIARDLVQETFFQALRSLPNFRGESKLSTWLYSIARNVALARYRKDKRHSFVEQETLTRMAEFENGSPASGTPASWNPVTETVQGEERALLHDALDDLSENYREIIKLRDLNELSTKEVAERLGLTRVNVRVRLHRARKKLKNVIDGRVESDYRVT